MHLLYIYPTGNSSNLVIQNVRSGGGGGGVQGESSFFTEMHFVMLHMTLLITCTSYRESQTNARLLDSLAFI